MFVIRGFGSPVPIHLLLDKEEKLIMITDSGSRIVHLLLISIHTHARVVYGHSAIHGEAIILHHCFWSVLLHEGR